MCSSPRAYRWSRRTQYRAKGYASRLPTCQTLGAGYASIVNVPQPALSARRASALAPVRYRPSPIWWVRAPAVQSFRRSCGAGLPCRQAPPVRARGRCERVGLRPQRTSEARSSSCEEFVIHTLLCLHTIVCNRGGIPSPMAIVTALTARTHAVSGCAISSS